MTEKNSSKIDAQKIPIYRHSVSSIYVNIIKLRLLMCLIEGKVINLFVFRLSLFSSSSALEYVFSWICSSVSVCSVWQIVNVTRTDQLKWLSSEHGAIQDKREKKKIWNKDEIGYHEPYWQLRMKYDNSSLNIHATKNVEVI